MSETAAVSIEEGRVSELVEIVTNLDRALESLSEDARESYEDAQSSVVAARNRAEIHEGFIRVL